MNEKSKLGWLRFRFRLATALVTMLAAGAAMVLIFRERAYYPDNWSPTAYDAARTVGIARGWPLTFYVMDNRDVGDGAVFIRPFQRWSNANLAVDMLALFVALVVVAVTCESVLRRREGRQS